MGEATIQVTYSGCARVRATLDGKEVGRGILPLKTPVMIGGKEIVAACGKLGLTVEEVERIEVAIAAEKELWDASPDGLASAAEVARMDRCAERAAQIAWHGDINRLERE